MTPVDTPSSMIDEIKASALGKLSKMGLPLEKESWRKINLSGFDLSKFSPESSETELAFQGTCGFKSSFADAPEEAAQKISESLKKEAEDADDIFAVQNLASFQKSLYLKAAPGPQTVNIRHTPGEGASALIHNVFIDVPDSCEITVIEEFLGMPSGSPVLWNCRTHASVGCNAKLNYIQIRYFTDNEQHFNSFVSDQKRDSRVHVTDIRTGGISGKSFVTGRVNEPGASFRGIGIGYGAKREFDDMEMCVEHYASHTESSLHYRNVQKDRAHCVFTGNLYIPKGLVDVQSHQLNNNILLDKRARAQSIPKIIIEAESVQCDHGATVGEISEEALLYLASRGIPEQDARTLLIEGFAVEVIDEIPAEEIRAEILEKLKETLSI